MWVRIFFCKISVGQSSFRYNPPPLALRKQGEGHPSTMVLRVPWAWDLNLSETCLKQGQPIKRPYHWAKAPLGPQQVSPGAFELFSSILALKRSKHYRNGFEHVTSASEVWCLNHSAISNSRLYPVLWILLLYFNLEKQQQWSVRELWFLDH